MKAKDMRDRRPEELQQLLTAWREELFRLNVQSMTGQLEKSSRARGIKKNIARVLTILREQVGRDEKPGRESEAS